jgi:hypothetical protein
MWAPLLEPGVTRVHASARQLWSAVQEVVHHAVRKRGGTVLVCDGSHGFNPYDYAELNLVRGAPAEFAAHRVLVKRAMTAFQWDTILDKQLAARLAQGGVDLVVAAPYDSLFAHEELVDWEQEDHLRYSVGDLAVKAERHGVPILAFVDTHRQARSHPALWAIQEEGIRRKWRCWRQGGAWQLVDEADPEIRVVPGTLESFERPLLHAPLRVPPRVANRAANNPI